MRYFLNSLFEAPCASDEGQPSCSTAPTGPSATTSATCVVNAGYGNAGPGIATSAVLALALPAGATFVSASNGGVLSGNTVTWTLGSLGPGTYGSPSVTVTFGAEGTYTFSTSLSYWVGLNQRQVTGGPLSVRYGTVSLLRFGGVTSLSPMTPANSEIFVAQYPVDPALDAVRDLEEPAFVSGASFPHDSGDLSASPALIYYELQGNSGNTLRVTKSGGRVVITY